MEVDAELVVSTFNDIHFKYELSSLSKEYFLKSLKAVCAAFFDMVCSVSETASLDSCAAEVSRIKTSFLRFIAEEIEPEGPVLPGQNAHLTFKQGLYL